MFKQFFSLAFLFLIAFSNICFAQKEKTKPKTNPQKEKTEQKSTAQKEKTKPVSKYAFEGALFSNRARVMQKVKNVPMWGFIDKNNSMVIGFKYNESENFKDGLAKVRKGHFWGLIDSTGKEVIPIAFDWVGDFEGDRAKVIRLGQKAYIDRTGKIVGRE